MFKRVIFEIVVLLVLATVTDLSASARTLRTIDDNDTVLLSGNVHPQARPEFDRGATEPSLPMERMILTVRLAADKQAALEKFLADQHDQTSADFHRWLTPEEFGMRFGPSAEDIGAITGWLVSRGFTVEEVSSGLTWINFSGTVSHVEAAFHTKIHDYYVDGHLRHANARDPAIPRGLADLVSGVVSLHNFPRKAMNSGIRPLNQDALQPDYTTSGGSHFLSPGDFAIIYNVKALYGAGIDGTGQSIAIVGRTHPSSSNWSTFRSTMGLPANPPQVIVNGPDPGDQGANEDSEADLDVEWSGAVARNATIKFVTSKSTHSTDGVDLSAQYIINNNLAPVMSTSFGLCEFSMGSAGSAFYNSLWQQAAAQGITSFVSTGDSGAAGCSNGNASSGSGLGINGLASTQYNVAVGGTQFNDGAGGYWNSTNGTGDTSAIGYIPEAAWNESGNVSGGSGLWATGGGVSIYNVKPSWQVAPGVPADGMRDVPDVSLSAAGHDAYLVISQGSLMFIAGTSAASPSFAGIMALIVQKTGQRQGNANIAFYRLANAQFNSGYISVFHDITTGNNSVPGVAGYSCVTGYDLATGLGSVDANALVNNWDLATPPTVLSTVPANGATGVATSAAVTAFFSQPMTAATINASTFTLSNGITGTVTYDAGSRTATLTPSTVLTLGTTYTATITTGVANAAGIAMTTAKSWSFTTIPAQLNTTTAVTSNINPSAGGQTVTFTATVSPAVTGGTVTFKDGATVLGTIAVSGGTATYSTSALGTGSHSITAVYSGDGSHNGSTSPPLTQTVSANLTVMLQGASITYFTTISDAYTNANTGDTIKSQTRTYPENLQFNRAISIKLDGGYDSFFLISSGFTTIKGSLDVSRGTVDISKINFIL